MGPDTTGLYESNMHRGGEFRGGPVIKIQSFHCRGHWLDPWLEN